MKDCPNDPVCLRCPCADEDDVCFPGERLRAERDEALHWLRKLADWGYGENAPDLAKQDWADARAYLGPRDA